jgi:hypothetical protein
LGITIGGGFAAHWRIDPTVAVSHCDQSRPSTLGLQTSIRAIQLAVSLPRTLEKIEAALATAGPYETRRLHRRAELIRELLAPPGRSPTPS